MNLLLMLLFNLFSLHKPQQNDLVEPVNRVVDRVNKQKFNPLQLNTSAITNKYVHEEINTSTELIAKMYKTVETTSHGSYRSISKNDVTQVLLSDKQTDFIRDKRNHQLNGEFIFKLDLRGKDFEGWQYISIKPDIYWPAKTEESFTLKGTSGKEVKGRLAIDQFKMIPKLKNNNHGFEFNVRLEFDNEEWEKICVNSHEDVSIDLTLEKILLEANTDEIDLTRVFSIPQDYHFEVVDSENAVEKYFDKYKEKFNSIYSGYEFPEDFVDWDKTWKNLKYEALNIDEISRIRFRIYPNDKYRIKGEMIQEFRFKKSIYSIRDFLDIKWTSSYYLVEDLERMRIEYDNGLKTIAIDLLNKKVGIDLDPMAFTWISFDNVGPIKDIKKIPNVQFLEGKEKIAEIRRHKLTIYNAQKLGSLVDELFEKDTEISKEETAKVEETNAEKEIEVADEIIDEADNNQATSKKKSKPLKYLWLLTIPITAGLGILLSWFIPFIKKRKSK